MAAVSAWKLLISCWEKGNKFRQHFTEPPGVLSIARCKVLPLFPWHPVCPSQDSTRECHAPALRAFQAVSSLAKPPPIANAPPWMDTFERLSCSRLARASEWASAKGPPMRRKASSQSSTKAFPLLTLLTLVIDF